MESIHRSCAGGVGTIVDKGAIALGYEEDALNVLSGIFGEMIFEVHNVRSWWEITDPEGVSRLLWLSRRSSGNGKLK